MRENQLILYVYDNCITINVSSSNICYRLGWKFLLIKKHLVNYSLSLSSFNSMTTRFMTRKFSLVSNKTLEKIFNLNFWKFLNLKNIFLLSGRIYFRNIFQDWFSYGAYKASKMTIYIYEKKCFNISFNNENFSCWFKIFSDSYSQSNLNYVCVFGHIYSYF